MVTEAQVRVNEARVRVTAARVRVNEARVRARGMVTTTGKKAKKQEKAKKRQLTSSARQKKKDAAQRKVAHAQLKNAIAFCMEHDKTANNIGPKRYPNRYKRGGQWEHVKNSTLHENLKKIRAKGAKVVLDAYASRRILTDPEDASLAVWCLLALEAEAGVRPPRQDGWPRRMPHACHSALAHMHGMRLCD